MERDGEGTRRQGTAVQVDPMKPTLKAPGSERPKLNCDDPGKEGERERRRETN
jgi:hypothetical protein